MRVRSYILTLPLVATILTSAAALTFAIGQPANAETAKPQANTESARSSVQQFYNWYLPAQPKGNGSKDGYAIKQKSSMFSTELKQKLEEDEKASAKSPGEIVGLDFDPFTNAQDDPERIVVGKATMKGSNYFVEAFRANKAGKKESNKPDVTPELTLKNGSWVFVNFHYPASGTPGDNDLLSILKGLAADRVKNPAH